MNDLERFFVQLVQALNASDPARLRQPIGLEDIMRTVLPYRAYRRALQLDSSEDYELVLMRLCAGEGGYLRTDPPEALARFQAEVARPHADLAVIDDDEGVTVTLVAERVAQALAPQAPAESAYAPPAAPTAPQAPEQDDALPLDEVRWTPPPPRPPVPQDPEAETLADGDQCSYCGGGLPQGRIVNYCPHCGQSQAITRCPECRGEVEIGWRHCITCGYALGS
ncbi:MAG: zinc ribbon domain-containing protein [Gemmatimonadales bacterium]|nr:zinc ribbon domain-containing protein [Gemmatimonadales bacterium]